MTQISESLRWKTSSTKAGWSRNNLIHLRLCLSMHVSAYLRRELLLGKGFYSILLTYLTDLCFSTFFHDCSPKDNFFLNCPFPWYTVICLCTNINVICASYKKGVRFQTSKNLFSPHYVWNGFGWERMLIDQCFPTFWRDRIAECEEHML